MGRRARRLQFSLLQVARPLSILLISSTVNPQPRTLSTNFPLVFFTPKGLSIQHSPPRAYTLIPVTTAVDCRNLSPRYAEVLQEERKEYDGAIELYSRAIKHDPSNSEALRGAAALWWVHREDAERAGALFREAIEVGSVLNP